jgi:beta-glucosidase
VRVGIAATGRLCWPSTDSPADVEAACNATFATPDNDWAFTYQMVLDPVCFGHYPENCGPGLRRMTAALPAEDLAVIHIRPDFIGLNIYNGHAVCAGTGKRPVYVPRPRGCAVTALKWPVTPLVMNWGVRFLWQRYGRPIYITENGQSCNDRIFLDGRVHDPDRIDFLHRYLLALRAAAEGGADVRGYFHWALTDNFEWSEGYRERFGLVYIDYVTGARIPKDSAAWYAETVRANGENL